MRYNAGPFNTSHDLAVDKCDAYGVMEEWSIGYSMAQTEAKPFGGGGVSIAERSSTR